MRLGIFLKLSHLCEVILQVVCIVLKIVDEYRTVKLQGVSPVTKTG